jgi:hypothetical protein
MSFTKQLRQEGDVESTAFTLFEHDERRTRIKFRIKLGIQEESQIRIKTFLIRDTGFFKCLKICLKVGHSVKRVISITKLFCGRTKEHKLNKAIATKVVFS